MSQPGLVLKSSSSESTREIGSIIASVCHPGDVIALSGDLGAGKTTLTQGIAKGLGIDESVTSPTFIRSNTTGDRVGLTHIDLYRLESEEEALALDLDELFYGDSVVVVEWPDRFMSVFPDQYLLLTISYSGLDERVVEVTGVGQRGDELVEKLRELFSGSQYL